MITAEEAKLKQREAIDKMVPTILECISQKVKTSVENGCDSAVIKHRELPFYKAPQEILDPVYDKVVSYLKEAGYAVITGDFYGKFIRVMW